MGARAEVYAKQLEEANADVIAAVESTPDAAWSSNKGPEEWPVCVLAHHIGDGHAAISQLVMGVASGAQLPPLTMDMIHHGNAAHAKQFANCTKADTLQLLREGVSSAAAAVRGLSDEQLDRSAELFGRPMTAANVIEYILIGHVRDHLGSIKAALA